MHESVKERVDAAAEALFDLGNIMTCDSKEAAEVILNCHRTVQTSILENAWALIKLAAERTDLDEIDEQGFGPWTDARNVFAYKRCKSIIDAVEAEDKYLVKDRWPIV